MARRSLTPQLLAAVTAAGSSGLLWAAVANGWLGPDVGRGDGFCEAARDALVKQPANTFSNLGFVLAGLLIGWHAGDPRRTIVANPTLATAYAMVVVLLGPASAAMHATRSAAGGHLDLLSMYLVAAFAFACAVTRLVGRGTATFAVLWVVVIGGCELVERVPGHVPVVDIWANLAFSLLLLAAVTGEWVLWRRGESVRDPRWGFASVAALGAGVRDLDPGQDRRSTVPTVLAGPGACDLAPARRGRGLRALSALCQRAAPGAGSGRV